jgi:YbbR domain-containing protein
MISIFEKNITLKIVSVIFAIILWLIAIKEQNPEIPRSYDNVPVKAITEDELKEKGLILVHDINDKVSISVRGRARDLDRVDVEQLSGTIDLSVITEPGEHKIPVEILGLPGGVNLKRKPEILVKVDYLISKDIPVTAKIDIQEAPGFQAWPYRIKPANFVKIFGPEALIKRVYQASVILGVTDAASAIEQSLPIQLLDRDGQTIESKYIRLEPKYAVVTVPVYPLKVLPVKPSIAGKPEENYEVTGIEVYPREITVSGDKSILDKLDTLGTEILDIQGASFDVKRTLKLQQYDGISIAPSHPNQVEVLVRISEINIESTLSAREIQMVNIPTNRQAELEVSNAEVVVRGPISILNNLEDEAIRLYVDLSDVSSRGEHRLKIMVDIPEGVDLLKVTPNETTVSIK